MSKGIFLRSLLVVFLAAGISACNDDNNVNEASFLFVQNFSSGIIVPVRGQENTFSQISKGEIGRTLFLSAPRSAMP